MNRIEGADEMREDGPSEAARLFGVVGVFDRLFGESHQVTVAGGFDEPFYRAPREDRRGEIQFRHDYLNSCLHEISHWLLAGEARLKLDDFGYWYVPDGRNAEEQAAFYKAEVKPQALERALAEACGAAFRLSVDNLGDPRATAGESSGGGDRALDAFAVEVEKQYQLWRRQGFPGRASRFLAALHAHFSSPNLSI